MSFRFAFCFRFNRLLDVSAVTADVIFQANKLYAPKPLSAINFRQSIRPARQMPVQEFKEADECPGDEILIIASPLGH